MDGLVDQGVPTNFLSRKQSILNSPESKSIHTVRQHIQPLRATDLTPPSTPKSYAPQTPPSSPKSYAPQPPSGAVPPAACRVGGTQLPHPPALPSGAPSAPPATCQLYRAVQSIPAHRSPKSHTPRSAARRGGVGRLDLRHHKLRRDRSESHVEVGARIGRVHVLAVGARLGEALADLACRRVDL